MKELDKLDKKDGFKVPEGYFENLHGRLLDQIDGEQQAFPKEDGFVIPDNYFEGLHKDIRQKLNAEEPKVVQLRSYRKYYLAAASIAAIILVWVGLNRETEVPISFQDIVSSDIDSYFESHDIGLSSFEIAEVLPIEDVEINDLLENQIKEENIVDYLDEHIDDFEGLNLEDHEVY